MEALDLLLVEGAPTPGCEAERIQFARNLAKAHPLGSARSDQGRGLPHARVLPGILLPHEQALAHPPPALSRPTLLPLPSPRK
jgi:hypothetical protein